jgi:protein TonB
MFEDSLVASKPASISAATQWTTIGSAALQSAAAALIVILPLLHPERLPIHIEPPRVFTPLLPKPVIHIQPAATSSSTTSSVAPATAPPQGPILRFSNNHSFPAIDDSAPPLAPIATGMGDSPSLPPVLTTVGNSTNISAVPVHSNARPRISDGVAAGMLLTPIRPVYPAIAHAAGVQGTVIVEAVISRTGTIEDLRVVGGPPMLRQAAIDAIRAARYQPYRLSGEPIEVQATITVNFRLGA